MGLGASTMRSLGSAPRHEHPYFPAISVCQAAIAMLDSIQDRPVGLLALYSALSSIPHQGAQLHQPCRQHGRRSRELCTDHLVRPVAVQLPQGGPDLLHLVARHFRFRLALQQGSALLPAVAVGVEEERVVARVGCEVLEELCIVDDALVDGLEIDDNLATLKTGCNVVLQNHGCPHRSR